MSPIFKEMGIVRRRRKICSTPGCIEYSGDKRKTKGKCWRCWWRSLK